MGRELLCPEEVPHRSGAACPCDPVLVIWGVWVQSAVAHQEGSFGQGGRHLNVALGEPWSPPPGGGGRGEEREQEQEPTTWPETLRAGDGGLRSATVGAESLR